LIYDRMRHNRSYPSLRQIGSEFSVGRLRGDVMDWLNSRSPAKFNGLDTEWLPGGYATLIAAHNGAEVVSISDRKGRA
jgi:hypothetical protein